jgi:hypothetical protein
MKRTIYDDVLQEDLKLVESIYFQLEDMEPPTERKVIEGIAERGYGVIKVLELCKPLKKLDDIEYAAATIITDTKKEAKALEVLKNTPEVLKQYFHAKLDVVHPFTIFNHKSYQLKGSL